jgi:hypothetical protein
MKATSGKKSWNSPFRRQLPRIELVRKSPGGRWRVVTDASPPRVTGRDLEARGLAKRLFPPDPIPEIDDGSEYDRCSVSSPTSGLQTPHEPFHRRSPPKNQPPLHDASAGPSCEPQSRFTPTQPTQPTQPPQPSQSPQLQLISTMSPQQTDPESLPSPLDGSPLPSMVYLPRSVPPTKTREHPRCRCKHCGHSRSESSVPQSPSVASTVPKEPSPLGGSPLCHTCPQHSCPSHAPKSSPPSKGRKPPIPCEYPSSAPADSPPKIAPSPCPKIDTKAIPQETPKAADHHPSMPTPESLKVTREEPSRDAVKNKAKDAAKAHPPEIPKLTRESSKTGMALWQILLITMGLVIFVFAFAILIAHCLAWFLVFKTESRLGEVRAGLLRGGEMRLCLCGRGG